MKIKTKEEAREYAILYQHMSSEIRQSYAEVAQDKKYFYLIGKKFGLLKEFKENGII